MEFKKKRTLANILAGLQNGITRHKNANFHSKALEPAFNTE
jgi:hypothetical protein